MNYNTISSKDYKRTTTVAVLAIIFFMLIYLILLTAAAFLLYVCVYFGVIVIASKITFLTILVGGASLSVGFLITFFLIKFIFKKNKVDTSHMVLLNEKDEPEFYNFIRNIATEVGTDFPKKIYLTPEVNAGVFYDSSFWSMFLPIRKNLQIGLGLINSVTVTELHAILAHEFGHFSQKTMKVGSYVYNVNQIIFNLLYENESLESFAVRISNVHVILSLAVSLSLMVIKGIQWLLGKSYNLLNISYLKLSREMEFQADEIAAHSSGSQGLISGLLHINFANYSYTSVLDFYDDKYKSCLTTDNIYDNQKYILKHLAQEGNIDIINELPDCSLEYLNRYDKSKLVIKDQWASHPSLEDRINALNQLNLDTKNQDNRLASILFINIEDLEKQVTKVLFKEVKYQNEPVILTNFEFIKSYNEYYSNISFQKMFNGYYNHYNPSININNLEITSDIHFEELYSVKTVNYIYESYALKNDIATLESIAKKEFKIKTFDYDGVKYSRKDAGKLIIQLNTQLEQCNKLIKENDDKIYKYFNLLAIDQNKENEFKAAYSFYSQFDKEYDIRFEVYNQLNKNLEFLNVETPFHTIAVNFENNKETENMFRKHITDFLSKDYYLNNIDSEQHEIITKYLSKEWVYFRLDRYQEEALTVLNRVLQVFPFVMSNSYIQVKKQLVDTMAELEENKRI